MRILKISCIVTAVSLIYCCTKPFVPDLPQQNTNVLVVEGYINAGADSTFIRLSRTSTIEKKNIAKAETGAVVTVESDANDKYTLVEKTSGNYAAGPLGLAMNKKYRISIKSSNGATYQSDYMPVKAAPPIDGIGAQIKTDGLQVSVSAHDDTNATRYYRWEYEETWRFNAKYDSRFKVSGTSIVPRNLATENIYNCWGTNNSSKVLISSTIKLDKDIVQAFPLIFNASTSEKFQERYSILVKQYALTQQEFEFWQNLQKTTESLGSIFDAQPFEIAGNVHNVANDSEPVIGFVGVGVWQQKRIFINKSELPSFSSKYAFDCDTLFAVLENIPGNIPPEKGYPKYFFVNTLIPVSEVLNGAGQTIGYYGGKKECTDCTIRGTNKKPAFWF